MQTNDQPRRSGWRNRLLHWFRLTDDLLEKVYHGYGHSRQLTIFGHVMNLGPLPRRRYRKSLIHNTLALLRLFMVRPVGGMTVVLTWEGEEHSCRTDKDGFYRFTWTDKPPLPQGWHTVRVQARMGNRVVAEGEGKVYIPYSTQYGFISDIDDTFLISHSSNMRKRLWVLFTENARSRQPFEGVVQHYQLLAMSNTTPEAPNPFFYVSSSEWNLYYYILEFARVNQIPEGVFLLNQLKRFSELLKTGQSHHQTKFTRIARILESYPEQRFVLLGDSSQQDPYIYQAIVNHFPKQIHAVYIRDVYAKNVEKVREVLQSIESKGVACCFFKHSEEAIRHSQKIGLIPLVALPANG